MIAKIECFLLPIVFRNKYPENKVANRQLHGHPVFYRTLELPQHFLNTLLIGVSEMKALELVDFFGLRKIKHSAASIVGRCFHCDMTD